MADPFDERNAFLTKLGRKVREDTSQPGNKDGIVSEVIDLFSDGTRISATVWKPDGQDNAPKPAILLMHGWGGIRDHLDNAYAKKFCQVLSPSRISPKRYYSLTSRFRPQGRVHRAHLRLPRVGRLRRRRGRAEGGRPRLAAARRLHEPRLPERRRGLRR